MNQHLHNIGERDGTPKEIKLVYNIAAACG